MFGLDFVQDADFAGLAVGIFVDAEILLGHFVDLLGGAFFGDFNDTSADFQIAVGIRARETRGSRRTFLSFWRPRAELKMT